MDCSVVECVCDLLKSEILIRWVEIFAVVAGGGFALYRWHSDAMAKRSVQFRKLIDDFQSDENVKELLYILDDDEKKWFSEELVGDSNKGPVLDKLLFQMCYVIYLYKKRKFITKDEFLTLSYMIDRPLLNPQLQDYLYNLKMYAEGKGLQHPYKYLVDYGVEMCYLDARFKETKSLKKNRSLLRYNEYYKKWLSDEADFAKNNY